jgi:inorganic pyrophosphatase
MQGKRTDPIWKMMGVLFKAHPWHGLHIGDHFPETVTAFIELVPTDTVKFEVDKASGHLKLDRPQLYSNVCPALYGLVPRTYCTHRVAELSNKASGRTDLVGDGDPLDICVLTEKEITHGEIIVNAIPIGGFRMIDGNEADDKIIAVLEGDAAYGEMCDLADCPQAVIDRLQHYFLTYKMIPGQNKPTCEIPQVYGREEAHEVLRASLEDYQEVFSNLEDSLTSALRKP